MNKDNFIATLQACYFGDKNAFNKIVKEFDKYKSIINDLDTRLEELQYKKGIKDLDNFIWRLKLENLYDEKLEKFINDYRRMYE